MTAGSPSAQSRGPRTAIAAPRRYQNQVLLCAGADCPCGSDRERIRFRDRTRPGRGRLAEKAGALGVIDQLPKPIDQRALLRLVALHCEKVRFSA